jgi:hypothetical protein
MQGHSHGGQAQQQSTTADDDDEGRDDRRRQVAAGATPVQYDDDAEDSPVVFQYGDLGRQDEDRQTDKGGTTPEVPSMMATDDPEYGFVLSAES